MTTSVEENVDRILLAATVLGGLMLLGMVTGFADAGGNTAIIGDLVAAVG